jgi:hypothetical protein
MGKTMENMLVNRAKIYKNLNKRNKHKHISVALMAADIFLPKCSLL